MIGHDPPARPRLLSLALNPAGSYFSGRASFPRRQLRSPASHTGIMSLIHFHRVLISAGILFCAGFAAWELRAYLDDRDLVTLLISIAFAAAALALGYYLRHLSRFLRLPERDDDAPRPDR